MLIDYKDIEPIMYKEMKNSLNNLSHAYLFNINGNIYAYDMINSFIKNIICGEHKSKKEYEMCDLCKRIDNNNYTELKKIYPEDMSIKKEALDELQKIFSTKAMESNKRIYIIYDAEKLNKSAANSLLKFLEEPNEGIIAILMTNNINAMIETIVSRCQTLTFTKNKVEDYIKYNNINVNITLNKLSFSIWKIDDINYDLSDKNIFIENVIRFINKYELYGLKMIIYTKEYFHNYFVCKEDILKFFECLILFYTDVINYIIYGKVIYYDDYIESIRNISKKYSKDVLINRLNVIMKYEKLIKTNANINLLIDGMVIDMEGEV